MTILHLFKASEATAAIIVTKEAALTTTQMTSYQQVDNAQQTSADQVLAVKMPSHLADEQRPYNRVKT